MMGQPHSEPIALFRKQCGISSSPHFDPCIDVQRPSGLEGPTGPRFGKGQASHIGRTPPDLDVAFVPMCMQFGAP